jgi:hypothetical protein
MDVTGIEKFFDEHEENDLRKQISDGVYTYIEENALCYMNGLDKNLVRTYFLCWLTYTMERRHKGYGYYCNVERMFEEVETICKHFNLDYDELSSEAFNHLNTMKYKPKKEK